MSQGRGGQKSQLKLRELTLPPYFGPIQALKVLDDANSQCGGGEGGFAICFTQFTDSNANLVWKYPHRHSQKKEFYQLFGHSLAQSS